MTHLEQPPAPIKAQIRAQIRARRQQRSEQDRAAFAQRLAQASHPALDDATSVALFIGVGGEPDTKPLIATLHDRGVAILLPIVLPDYNLDWAHYEGHGSLVPAGFGLLEPSGNRLGQAAVGTVDVVVIPALAVDDAGRRVGQGAGCYDRALAHVSPRTPILAVVYDDERLSEALPEEPHDRRVDAILG